MLAEETSRLTALCDLWEPKIDRVEGEDVRGRIRAAVGKARILMNQKGRFSQFRQLVDNCEFGYGEKETTTMDLQGFWEMIYFQVEDVAGHFDQLKVLESNGWKEKVPEVTTKKTVPDIKTKKTKKIPMSRGPSVGLRAMMEAKRKEMQKKKEDPSGGGDATVKITVTQPQEEQGSGKPPSPAEKVFEGGFFRVTSPNTSRRTPEAKRPRTPEPDLEEAFESVALTPADLQSKSTSLPGSSASTPRDRNQAKARRSLLDSAARRLASSVCQPETRTPFAIMRVSSAFRRSMSRDNTPTHPDRPAFVKKDSKKALDFEEDVENQESHKSGKDLHEDHGFRRSARIMALKEKN